jgi:hemoglobin/transferrin/lactoferrin receptor protein
MSRLHFYITTLFLFAIQGLLAQTVKIIDSSTGAPIKDVAVYSTESSKSALSNPEGTFELSDIEGEKIIFQHTSYFQKSLSRTMIIENKNVVILDPRVIHLNQFVIAANKWEQPREDVPSKITSIDKAHIRTYNPQTAADLLASTNEVYVQKSQLAGGSPMIRGFSTNSVLLVFDGIRLNNAIYRTGNLQNAINIDPLIIESTEVIFGPGSVIYGSDALGGVMDFHSVSPDYATDEKLNISGNALMRYNSSNNEKTAHADIAFAKNNFTSFTSISFSDFNHLQMGLNGNENEQYLRSWYVERIDGIDSIITNEDPNTQIATAYKQYHLTQKFSWKATEHTELSYMFYYSGTSDLPRYDQLRVLSGGEPKYAEWYYGPQNLMINAVKAEFSKPTKIFNTAKINISTQNYLESRHYRKFRDNDLLSQNEKVNILTTNIDFEKTIKAGTGIVYGAEFLFNGLTSTAEEKNIVTNEMPDEFVIPRYPDGKNHWYSSALYGGFRHSMGKFILNTGIRYSYVALRSTFINDFYPETFGYDELKNKNGALNGSLGLTYKSSENTILYSNLSSGFHAPNWDGLAKVFTPKKGVVIVPNSELEPEYAYNGEIGITKHLFDKRATIEASVYYTYLDNAIVQREYELNGVSSLVIDGDTNRTEAFVNASYANLYGFNFAIQADLTKHLGIRSHLSYTYGRDAEDLPLRHVAPIFGATYLVYRYNKLSTQFYAVYNGAVTAENLAPSEKDKDNMYAYDEEGNLWSPSWYTLNFSLAWEISDMFSVNGIVENILDARYRPYASGICAPGRSVSLGINLAF